MANYVARIESSYFETLEDALAQAATSNNAVTIEVLQDTTLTSAFYAIKDDLTITAADKVTITLSGPTSQALYFGEFTADDPSVVPYSKVTVGKNITIDGAAYTISNWTPNTTDTYGYADLVLEGNANAAVVVWDSDLTIKGKVVDTLDRGAFEGNTVKIIGDGTATEAAPQYVTSALRALSGDLTIKDTVAKFTSGPDTPYADNVLAATMNDVSRATATIKDSTLFFNDNVIYVGRNHNTVDGAGHVSSVTIVDSGIVAPNSDFVIGAATATVTLGNASLDVKRIINEGTLNWDLSEGGADFDWATLSNDGTLSITVDVRSSEDATYVLADNANGAAGTDFVLTGLGADKTITVGGADVRYGTGVYALAVVAGDLVLTEERSDTLIVDGETQVIGVDMKVRETQITNDGALVLKDRAMLETKTLTLAGGTFDAEGGWAEIGDLVVRGTGNAIEGRVGALDRWSSVAVENGAELSLSKDQYDEFLRWSSFRSDGVLKVSASSWNPVTQDDFVALSTVNSIRAVDFVDQDVWNLHNIKFASTTNLTIGYRNGYGTEKNDKITIASGAGLILGQDSGTTDLSAGSNTLSVGSNADFTLRGGLENATTVSVSSGAKIQINGEKVQRSTRVSLGDVVGTRTFSIGNFADVALADFMGTAKTDSFTVGKDSSVSTGALDFGTGNDTLSVGARSSFSAGNVTGLKSISVSSGSLDNSGVYVIGRSLPITHMVINHRFDSELFPIVEKQSYLFREPVTYTTLATDDIEMEAAKAASITLGRYVQADFGDVRMTDFGDKITIGQDSIVRAGSLDFGAGNDVLSVGARSVFAADDLTGLKSIDVASGDVDGQKTLFKADDLSMERSTTVSLVFGNDVRAKLGDVTLSDRDDKVSLGKDAVLRVGRLDFGAGKDTLSVGARSTFDAEAIVGVRTLNVKSGTGAYDRAAKKYVASDVTKVAVADGVTGTEKADTFAFGDYVDVTLGYDAEDLAKAAAIDLGAGNDELSIGNGSTVRFGKLDFGEDIDTMSVGKDSTVIVDTLDGLDKLTIGSGSTLRIESQESYEKAIASDWYAKLSETAKSQISCGTLA